MCSPDWIIKTNNNVLPLVFISGSKIYPPKNAGDEVSSQILYLMVFVKRVIFYRCYQKNLFSKFVQKNASFELIYALNVTNPICLSNGACLLEWKLWFISLAQSFTARNGSTARLKDEIAFAKFLWFRIMIKWCQWNNRIQDPDQLLLNSPDLGGPK